MEIQKKITTIIINIHSEMTCNVVLILLRYYTYAHIHAHRDIEGSVYVCVLCMSRTCVCYAYRSYATRVHVRACARTLPCAHASRARMYVRICIIIVAYVARDTYVSTLYSVYVYNPSTSVFQSPSPPAPLCCARVRARVRLIEK